MDPKQHISSEKCKKRAALFSTMRITVIWFRNRIGHETLGLEDKAFFAEYDVRNGSNPYCGIVWNTVEYCGSTEKKVVTFWTIVWGTKDLSKYLDEYIKCFEKMKAVKAHKHSKFKSKFNSFFYVPFEIFPVQTRLSNCVHWCATKRNDTRLTLVWNPKMDMVCFVFFFYLVFSRSRVNYLVITRKQTLCSVG